MTTEPQQIQPELSEPVLWDARRIYIGQDPACFRDTFIRQLTHTAPGLNLRNYVLDTSLDGSLEAIVKEALRSLSIRNVKVRRAMPDDRAVTESLRHLLWDCDPGVLPNEVTLELPPRDFPETAAACHELATRWFYGRSAGGNERSWAFDGLNVAASWLAAVARNLSPTKSVTDESRPANHPDITSDAGAVALEQLLSRIVEHTYPRRPHALVIARSSLRHKLACSLAGANRSWLSFVQLADSANSSGGIWEWPEDPDIVFSDRESFEVIDKRWTNSIWVVALEEDAERLPLSGYIPETQHARTNERAGVIALWSAHAPEIVLPVWVTRPLGRHLYSLPTIRNSEPRPELETLRDTWKRGLPCVTFLAGEAGIGKTTLAAQFISEFRLTIERRDPDEEGMGTLPSADALFVWDFYAEPFTERFLQEFAGYLNPEISIPARSEEWLRYIGDALQSRNLRRVLLVLDGLDTIEQTGHEGVPGRGLQDESILALLNRIARGDWPVTAVVTTREIPAGMEERFGDGYFHLRLGGLSPEQASKVLRSCGDISDDDHLVELAARFGFQPLALYHMGRLIGDFYQGDVSVAAGWLHDEPVKGSLAAPFDEASASFYQVFQHYEKHLPQHDVAVLKGVALVGEPLTAPEFSQVFAHAPVEHVAARAAGYPVNELQASFDALRSRRLLNAHTGSDGVVRYAAHPSISRYFSLAMTSDARAASLGAARHYERSLNAVRRSSYNSGPAEARTGGAMRTRRAGGAPHGNPIAYPTSNAVLDLMEKIVLHTARGGQQDEARRFYQSRMGGDQHLTAIGQQGRIRRIRARLTQDQGFQNKE